MTSIPEDVKSEIPEDIQRKVGKLLGPPGSVVRESAYDIASLAIARAIIAERLAERERAAKIVCRKAYELLKPHFWRDADTTHVHLANEIASSIRSQSLSDKE